MATHSSVPPGPIAAAKDWIEKGQALSAKRRLQDLPEVIRCYGEAIRLLEPLCADPNNPLRDLLAVAYTHQAFTLLASRDEAAFPMVLASFDRAIALRTTLLGLGEPWFRYNLLGVWINRADALVQRGAKERLTEALLAYDEAVRLAADLDSAGPPPFAFRRAVAKLNRAGASLRLFDATRWAQAELDYQDALRDLESPAGPAAVLAASAWTGLGELALRRDDAAGARSHAGQALQLLCGEAGDSLEGVQTGLRARLLLGAISRKERDRPGADARAAELAALDQIEEGLAAVLRRPEKALLLPLIAEAFATSARLYGRRQPQFLAEFLREFLGLAGPELGDLQLRGLAVRELDIALGRLAREGLPSMQQETIESMLATVTGLRALRRELAGQPE